MNDLFQYVPGKSLLHRLNPVTKILLTIVICVAAFITNRLLFLVFLLALDLLIGIVAGVAKRTWSIFRGLLKIAVFLFILQALLMRQGTPVFWIITDQGLLTAGKVVLRLIVVCMPLALVLAVTRINDLTNALVQILHIPYQYAFTLTTAIRFIPQFLEEMSGIMEAQTARGVAFDKARGLKKFSMILPLCAPLLISSVRRTEQTAVAAEVRGFRLRTRTSGYKQYPFTAPDAAAALFCALLVAAAIIL
jgi:energy-coupling factor transport system permease protein